MFEVQKPIVATFHGGSGAGKTTMMKRLVALGASPVSSTTTRKRRSSDLPGEYIYLEDHAAFERMLQNEEFCWHDRVRGEYYGTTFAAVRKALTSTGVHTCALTLAGGLRPFLAYAEKIGRESTVVPIYLRARDCPDWRIRLLHRDLSDVAIEREAVYLEQCNTEALLYDSLAFVDTITADEDETLSIVLDHIERHVARA